MSQQQRPVVLISPALQRRILAILNRLPRGDINDEATALEKASLIMIPADSTGASPEQPQSKEPEPAAPGQTRKQGE